MAGRSSRGYLPAKMQLCAKFNVLVIPQFASPELRTRNLALPVPTHQVLPFRGPKARPTRKSSARWERSHKFDSHTKPGSPIRSWNINLPSRLAFNLNGMKFSILKNIRRDRLRESRFVEALANQLSWSRVQRHGNVIIEVRLLPSSRVSEVRMRPPSSGWAEWRNEWL